jgi:uncharacterized protein (DUF305 family)
MKTMIALAAAAIVAAGGLAYAQSPQHDKHGAHAPAAGTESAATQAYRAANDKMHSGMAIEYSGDADVDFMRGMIPHHQGAIDMARIVLEHGKDPAIRKLATDIIAAQEREISEMQGWLGKNAK